MAESHPAAPHDLPSFITPPGQTDVLLVVSALLLLIGVLGFGVLYFRLHALPERMAHTSHKIQFEIVAVLCLIALFTHMHIFWIAGLLLAMIDMPDFGTSLRRIADSAEKTLAFRSAEAIPTNSAEFTSRHEVPDKPAPSLAMTGDGSGIEASASAPAKVPAIGSKDEKELRRA